jgi:hypothetical protein
MLLQFAAGADHASSALRAFRPYDSLLAAPMDCFNEYDHAPRPVLAAWDWMARLLNDAACIRWYDKQGDVRAVVFEQASGRIVVAVWRAFGMSPHRLTLKGLASRADVSDVFGTVDAGAKLGADVVLRVDEIVRYVVLSSVTQDVVLAALDAAEPSVP